MTILVTGATGRVGRQLVAALTAQGAAVRALSRKPSEATGLPVPVAGPDATDLFDDVDRMFVFPFDNGVDDLLDRAVQAGVTRFVVLSSLAAAGEFPRDIGSASYLHHRAIEEAVTSRTDNWTVLRPGTFATNLLAWAWPIRAGAPIRAPYIHSAQAPIHEADIAEAAAATLLTEGHTARTYPLSGPQALTRAEQVATIGAALGRELPLVEVTPDEFRADVSAFIPPDIITMLLAYWSDTATTPDQVRPGVHTLTGHPARPLSQWATDHRPDFT
jgi:uncharacterized protein YbjT (DUF2867 family)